MPVAISYPGVYIEEIPSGVRTIVGVATSITAFIGRALLGPVDEPILINSFGDFERAFGGLQVNYPMSYAVRDFYLNGGSQAIIVRLFVDPAQVAAQAVADAAKQNAGPNPTDVSKAARDKANTYTNEPAHTAADTVAKAAETAATQGGATLDSVKKAAAGAVSGISSVASENISGFKLQAAYPGAWGNNLRTVIDSKGIDADVAKRYGVPATDLFNLTVVEMDGLKALRTEKFLNLAVLPTSGARRIDRALADSQLVRVPLKADGNPDLPNARPADTADANNPLIKGADDAGVVKFTGAANSDNLQEKDYLGSEADKKGLYALRKADLFNLLCIPPDARDGDVPKGVYQAALTFCRLHRAMLIVDPPSAWSNDPLFASKARTKLTDDLGLSGDDARNAALYFPRVVQSDPLRESQLDVFAPCGIVAGVMAKTDTQRGVWKAPAGIDAALSGVQGLAFNLSDEENGVLNQIGINCFRSFPIVGRVVWGSRTMRGADQLADEYKYIPIRRLALYIEETLYRNTQWIVFEPNDEPLWAQIRLNIGAFMQNLFRQGAFQGSSPRDAYFVKCDKETTTQNDINLGIVNIVVGFAPLKPAEFVVIKIQQMAGQVEA
jgi:Bacteriophage tail sheath protein